MWDEPPTCCYTTNGPGKQEGWRVPIPKRQPGLLSCSVLPEPSPRSAQSSRQARRLSTLTVHVDPLCAGHGVLSAPCPTGGSYVTRHLAIPGYGSTSGTGTLSSLALPCSKEDDLEPDPVNVWVMPPHAPISLLFVPWPGPICCPIGRPAPPLLVLCLVDSEAPLVDKALALTLVSPSSAGDLQWPAPLMKGMLAHLAKRKVFTKLNL